MYFPYLRGKQFELIALKEISSLLAHRRNYVSPIIEPVRDSPTLRTTIAELRSKNINFNIVINPVVGDMQNSTGKILTMLNKELLGYNNFQLAIILSGKENHNSVISILKENSFLLHGLTLIHEVTLDNIEEIVAKYQEIIQVKYNVVYLSKTNRRYHRNFNPSTLIELEDSFSSKVRNVDYKSFEESDFSEEHKFYKEEGFVGFSDFLTIGDNYSEGGFLPYAIAIHISYADSKAKIKIRHFVSDSNDDTSDIAGKFDEALKKLVTWCEKNKFETAAIKTFKELHKAGHFPGLGSVKKLSIENHIELVLSLI